MTIVEVALRTLNAARGLLVPIGVTAAVTATMMILLSIIARFTWVNQPLFDAVGLFYELHGWNRVRLASAWVKLWVVLSCLTILRNLEAAHYALLLIAVLLYSIEIKKPLQFLTNFLSGAAEAVGLLIASVLRNYIRDLELGFIANVICIGLCVLLALYAVYLFLSELNNISQERSVVLE